VRAAARCLADRVGDLGGAVTADPRQLIGRAPGDEEFTFPGLLGPAGHHQLRAAPPGRYCRGLPGVPGQGAGRDDVSFALVVGLLAAETLCRAKTGVSR
jgi:hypothetical protein